MKECGNSGTRKQGEALIKLKPPSAPSSTVLARGGDKFNPIIHLRGGKLRLFCPFSPIKTGENIIKPLIPVRESFSQFIQLFPTGTDPAQR